MSKGNEYKNNKRKEKTVSLRGFQELHKFQNLRSVKVKHENIATPASNYQDNQKVWKTTTWKAELISTTQPASCDKTEATGFIEKNYQSNWSNIETTDSKDSDLITSTSLNKREKNKKYDRKHGDTSDMQFLPVSENENSTRLDLLNLKSQNKSSYYFDDVGSFSPDKQEYDEFEKLFKEKKLIEKFGNLFEVSKEYALAHCVAEEMNMEAGIALHFRREFKKVDELLNQRQRQGGCAYLDVNGRYIYYLVTKRKSSGKPTNFTLWKSLCRMRCLIKEHGVKQLAMPTIGCGFDGLEWSKVKSMVEYVFRDYDIQILVYNFRQTEGAMSEKQDFITKGKVVYVNYSLIDIKPGTIILYFGSEDGIVTPLMKKLDKKFNFLGDYKNAHKRTVGEPIRSALGSRYILYGCIVNEKYGDDFDFQHFQKCLCKIHKLNKQDCYGYIAIEGDSYDLFISKIINLISYTFYDIELYVCCST